MWRSTLFLFASLTSAALAADPAAITAELRRQVLLLSSSDRIEIRGEILCANQSIARFYSMRRYEPAWSDAHAGQLLGFLGRIDEEGLDPAGYHLQTLQQVLTEKNLAPVELAHRDLLLTDAFTAAAHHLLNGRVDPETIIPTWCLTPTSIDLAAVLDAALQYDQVDETLERLISREPAYLRLRSALATYRGIAAVGGWPLVRTGPGLRLGDTGPRVAELRNRLMGEPGSPVISGSSESFDATVDAAVRLFQSRHGISEDGVVGAATVRELNVSVEQRIEQIILSLERWRWLPHDLGNPHVLVNLAGFSLDVIEDEESTLPMRVIVGKQFQKTPVFSGTIDNVVLNPFWNIPKSIAQDEVLPKARRDRTYLRREHIRVLPNGDLRQDPGPWNPLGQLKFNIPNPYSVYLHDTPARQLFGQSSRAFSHGCIRIEKPREFATYLLRDTEWSRERLDLQIAEGIEKWIRVPRPIQVHILYWTSWVTSDGVVHFTPDIYDRDEALKAALNQSPAKL